MADAATLAEAKKRLRRIMKARMEDMGEAGIAARSRALCRQILASREFREAGTLSTTISSQATARRYPPLAARNRS